MAIDSHIISYKAWSNVQIQTADSSEAYGKEIESVSLTIIK